MNGTVHRQVVYRLLPQTRGNWRRLERVLEAQRQLYNAALQERADAWRLAGRSITYIDQTKSLTECQSRSAYCGKSSGASGAPWLRDLCSGRRSPACLAQV